MDLLTSTENGKFSRVEVKKGSPVPDEKVLENIRSSYEVKIPVFRRKQKRQGSFIFVAGGPTLLDYLEEVKERHKNGEFICTSNKTYDFLISQGVIPDACMVIDPKEIVQTYIKNPNKNSTFYIGTVCYKKVFENLIDAGMNVEKLLIGYGLSDEEDIKLQKELYTGNIDYLVGGTMAGLRAMNFCALMGFSKVEYYGFDSCFSTKNYKLINQDDPQFEEVKKQNKGITHKDEETGREYVINEPNGGFFYAYTKKRGENILVAKVGERTFLTSQTFAHQAKQLIKWIDRVDGKVEVVVHGDSLTSYIIKLYKEDMAKKFQEIGDKRWTENYKQLQIKMHQEQRYGEEGWEDAEIVGRLLLSLNHSLQRKIKWLDYGCGKAGLADRINKIFKPEVVEICLYDPFIPRLDEEPNEMFDIITCSDVLEHVEIQCLENTLKHIKNHVKYMVYFVIGLTDAKKELSDGRNAHITQHNAGWWGQVISKHFTIVEGKHTGEFAWFTCQVFDADKTMQDEKREN